ncbi:MAG: RluA family pseudouridine synthase [Desulfobacterales bacterium]
MSTHGAFAFTASESDAGARLDVFLSVHLESCSRSHAARLIQKGNVLVDDRPRKPAYRLEAGDCVHGVLPEPESSGHLPEPMNLCILFEDDDILVLNKPAGRVVHPAPGHASGTLVNGILHHCPEIEGTGGIRRPGIVHRLDRDTSGLMVVAKTPTAHHDLSRQFKERRVRKTYLAIVSGQKVEDKGTISLSVSRHPTERKRMTTNNPNGRDAVTCWTVRERTLVATLLELDLKTGRTHQIRVHCAAEGHPVVGDAVYGGRRLAAWRRESERQFSALRGRLDPRQMLHAWKLEFHHPKSGRWMTFSSSLPDDMIELLEVLRALEH